MDLQWISICFRALLDQWALKEWSAQWGNLYVSILCVCVCVCACVYIKICGCPGWVILLKGTPTLLLILAFVPVMVVALPRLGHWGWIDKPISCLARNLQYSLVMNHDLWLFLPRLFPWEFGTEATCLKLTSLVSHSWFLTSLVVNFFFGGGYIGQV